MAAHSSPMTDFLTQTETLSENSESAASEPPEKRIPLSSDAEKQEHDKAILLKKFLTGKTCSIFLALLP